MSILCGKSISVLLCLIICLPFIVEAQQQPQYSQYMNNNYIINPAVGGSEDFIDIKASYRNQWVGFEGAPVTYYLSGHTPLGKQSGKPYPRKDKFKNYHGLGAYLYNDRTGPFNRTAGYLSYSYNMALNQKLRVAMGAFLGLQQYKLNGDQLNFYDNAEALGIQSSIVPDASVGVWLYNHRFYAGISTTQLFQNNLGFVSNNDISLNQGGYGKLNNHYFITSGIRISINPDLFIVPSILVKVVSPAPISIDLNAKLKYKNFLWCGLSYRNMDAVYAMAGVTIKELIDIGYSYDTSISSIRYYNSGSHEILIGVRLKLRQRLQCPANFW